MLVFMGCSAVLSLAAASAVLRRQPVRRVAIVGGTHGNELLGVQLIGMLEQRPEETSRPSFESVCVLANPEAVRRNTRYVTTDLNRCFSAEALAAEVVGDSVEARRAQELDALLGPKASDAPQCDLCLDLHTTTSKMGTCLMMAREDALAVELAAHLQRKLPSTRIVFWAKPRMEQPTLPTIARSGMTVEVGGLPQGVCTAAAFRETRELIRLALALALALTLPQTLALALTVALTVTLALPLARHPVRVRRRARPLLPRDDHPRAAAAARPAGEG
jgi:aspartoacylase